MALSAVKGWSNPVDLFSSSAQAGGTGDAVASSCTGPDCLYFNPGRLCLGGSPRILAGVTAQHASLSVPGGSTGIPEPFYSHVGAAIAPPFGGILKDRLWVGILLVAPGGEISLVRIHTPSEPFYPYYENRSQRLLILPGISLLAHESPSAGRIGLGLGFNYFAGLDGGIAAAEGATRAMEARVSLELKGILGLVAGAAWEKGHWAAGITYRQAMGVDFHTLAFNDVAGTSIDMEISAAALYSPHTLQWGVSYNFGTQKVQIDIIEQLWSFYDGPFVQIDSIMPMVGALSGQLPPNEFRNTAGVRAGWQKSWSSSLTLRAGAGFDPSFVKTAQTGITNLLDAHKLILSAGISWKFSDSFVVHAFSRMHILFPATHRKKRIETACTGQIPDEDPSALYDEKPCDADDPSTEGFQTSNPGFPSVTASGFVLMGGLSLEALP